MFKTPVVAHHALFIGEISKYFHGNFGYINSFRSFVPL
jgi:hypothetical protein